VIYINTTDVDSISDKRRRRLSSSCSRSQRPLLLLLLLLTRLKHHNDWKVTVKDRLLRNSANSIELFDFLTLELFYDTIG